jgi:hypothetical protein
MWLTTQFLIYVKTHPHVLIYVKLTHVPDGVAHHTIPDLCGSPHDSWFMWLTHTIPDLCGSPTIPDLCGSPTRFLIYAAHDSWFVAHPHIPDLCGSPTRFLIMCSPTQFLIYVAHPHIPDLCGSPTIPDLCETHRSS